MNWSEILTEHQNLFQQLGTQEENIQNMGNCIIDSLKKGGSILIAGNGGSAADAQHFAAELTGRFVKERRALAGIALTTDTSALTAIANDYGYENVFARQLSGIGKAGDVFIGISTSGNSPNILLALEQAQKQGIQTLGLSGRDGGKMKELCTYCFIAPSKTTARIQEAHIFAIHYLCALVDEAWA